MYNRICLASNDSLTDFLNMDIDENSSEQKTDNNISSVQAETRIPTENQVPQSTEQNTDIMLIALIGICIAILFLALVFLKLRNSDYKTDKKKQNKIKRDNSNRDNNFKQVLANEIQVENVENEKPSTNVIPVNKEEEEEITENNIDSSFKLGTPKNIEGCIRNFLEITKDK